MLELSTSFLFGLTAWHFGLSWRLPAYLTLVVGLVGLSWIDLRITRLPRVIIYWTAAIGVPLLCVAALVEHQPRRIWMLVLGAGIGFAIMGLIYLAARGGMGDGDVRIAPLLGAYLGFLNPGLVPVGLFFGFFAGAVVGVALMAAQKAGRKSAVPFGPFLALGTIVAIFVGQDWIDLILAR